MTQSESPVEAEIIHKLPRSLATKIGLACAAHSRLEHMLLMAVSLLLQLQKVEARVTLRNGRTVELFETALTLFALKDIDHRIDKAKTRKAIKDAKRERDTLAHSIWLQHPQTKRIYIRLVRGTWEEASNDGFNVSRDIYPQAKLYDASNADKALKTIEEAIALIGLLGKSIDFALATYPDRFRSPAPILDHLARREATRRHTPPPPKSPPGKG